MSVRELTGRISLAGRQLGRPAPGTTNCLWGDCSDTRNGDLPPQGTWLNLDTGDTSTENYNLAPGRWIDWQGNITVIPFGPADIKKPPLSWNGVGYHQWYHGQQGTAPADVIPATPVTSATPVTPAPAANDGLWFGFEPTTVLWTAGGIAAALVALAYLPAITATPGGKS